MPDPSRPQIWLAAGVRTPFAKVDGPLAALDAIAMSVPLVQHMVELLDGGLPDLALWGSVVPSLTWSNIGREVLMDAGVRYPFSGLLQVMVGSTSMVAAFEAAGMLDGPSRNPGHASGPGSAVTELYPASASASRSATGCAS